MFCRQCGKEILPNSTVCTSCGVPAGTGNNFCPNCGATTNSNAVYCVKCGAPFYQQPAPSAFPEQKSKLAAGLLAFFLGSLGIHNFYLGYTQKAVIQLCASLLGGVISCGIATVGIQIWAIVEGVMILTGSISVDGKGIPLKD